MNEPTDQRTCGRPLIRRCDRRRSVRFVAQDVGDLSGSRDRGDAEFRFNNGARIAPRLAAGATGIGRTARLPRN